MFDAFDIISWPLKVDFAGGNIWNAPAYWLKNFNVVANLERKLELKRQFYIMQFAEDVLYFHIKNSHKKERQSGNGRESADYLFQCDLQQFPGF